MMNNGGLSHLFEAAAALADLEQQFPPSASKRSSSTKTEAIVSDEETVPKKTPRVSIAKSREIFPQRLMDMLNDPNVTEIITWLPHGRAFVIIRPDLFTEQVLPKYLPPADARSSTKYASFTRKLNRWGFRQATRGPDTGAFHHPLFRRDQPDLCHGMVCQRSRNLKQTSHGGNSKKHELLTEETLGTVQSEAYDQLTTVSLSDGDRSDTSSDLSSSTLQRQQLLPNISNDKSFVNKVLQNRDEDERLKTARCLLYQSYIDAVSRS